MESTIWVKCPNCNGKGKITSSLQDLEICPTCNGKGIISKVTGLPPCSDVTMTFKNLIPNSSPSVKPQYWKDNVTSTNSKGERCYIGGIDMCEKPELTNGQIFECGKICVPDYTTSITNKSIKYK